MKKSFHLYILFSILNITLSLNCPAQKNNFTTLTVEDGLSQSQVYCIYQDKKGYLWFGTNSGGVSKYNGRTFENYTKENGLSNNQVYSITEDVFGNLWFGTYEGVSVFDGKNFNSPGILQSLEKLEVKSILQDGQGNIWFGTNNGIRKLTGDSLITFEKYKNTTIHTIFEDSKGNIWFGTLGTGIISLQNSEFITYTTEDGLANNTVWTIIEDRKGFLWIGTDKGISKYDLVKRVGDKFTYYDPLIELNNFSVRTLLNDNEGNLWIGTIRNGVYKFDGNTLTSFTTKQGLSNDGIYAIFEDRENNIWIGTDGGGITKYIISPFITISKRDGLHSNLVLSVLEDSKGNLWFGTYKGASRYDGDSFYEYNKSNGLTDEKVWSIIEDNKGNIWISSYGDGVFKYTCPPSTRGGNCSFTNYTKKDGLSNNNVRTIFEDSQGNIWIGTAKGINKFDGKKFTIYTQEDGIISHKILAIYEDSKRNMWFATSGGGLSKLALSKTEDKKALFINYTNKKACPDGSKNCIWGLSNNIVLSITEDNDGNIWCANYNGISKIISDIRAPKNIINITKENGLSSNTTYIILNDGHGNLIIGTNAGIDIFDVKEYNITGKLNFKHFGRDEGFSGIECNTNAWCKDKDGNIWFGTIKGAVKYIPDQDKPNTTEPLTHITGIRLFFEEFDWLQYSDKINFRTGLPINLVLPYDKNHLTIDFIGISMTIPEKVQYRFKLDGFDKGGARVTKESSVTYTNLPPGKYTVKVKARNNDGVWNQNATTFKFEIIPPFWQTWWFYLLSIIIGIILLFIAYYIRVRSLRKSKVLLEIKIKIHTANLEKQKVKIEEQNFRLEKQRHQLNKSNKQLEQQAAELKEKLKSRT